MIESITIVFRVPKISLLEKISTEKSVHGLWGSGAAPQGGQAPKVLGSMAGSIPK